VPLAVEACSSSDAAGPTADAGDESAADTGPPDSATCDLSANLLDKIPDAEIPDSSTTTGVCLGCVNAKCESSIAQCNASCPCQAAVASGLQCYLNNPAAAAGCITQFTGGGGGFDPNVSTIAFALLPCVQNGCPTECAQKPKGGETDGG
jgi:hypothetical protein